MKKVIFIVLIISVFLLSACSQTDDLNTNETENESSQTTSVQAESQDTTQDTSQLDVNYPNTDFIYEVDDNLIAVNDKDAVITNSGSYEFTGDYNSITVNVDKDIDEGVVYLVLNNANITSQTSTPINIIEGKDVVLLLEGTNTVTQGEISTTDTEFPSAAIYSKADTAISGDGGLTVTTSYQDGINSRDDLIIDGGDITVNSVEDGIVGKDLLAISKASIDIDCGKDGLKTSNDEDEDRGNLIIIDGNYNIDAENDGISAQQEMQIDGGTFNILSGGGFEEVLNEITMGEGSGNTVQPTELLEDSMKSIKANDIVINGGEFILSSYEDAIHSNGDLTINDGVIEILSGDDAIHADLGVTINNGDITITNAYEGIEGSTIDICGGDINVNVLDDAINASSESGYVKITDGRISLKSQGDGIDSNGDLYIEGGDTIIEVNAIYEGGDSELDVNGVYSISGGSVTDENGNEVDVIEDMRPQGGRHPF